MASSAGENGDDNDDDDDNNNGDDGDGENDESSVRFRTRRRHHGISTAVERLLRRRTFMNPSEGDADSMFQHTAFMLAPSVPSRASAFPRSSRLSWDTSGSSLRARPDRTSSPSLIRPDLSWAHSAHSASLRGRRRRSQSLDLSRSHQWRLQSEAKAGSTLDSTEPSAADSQSLGARILPHANGMHAWPSTES